MKVLVIAFTLVGWLGLHSVSAEELFDVRLADQHFNSGLNFYFKNDYLGAIEEFQEAVRINPENAKAYYFIGYSYYKRGHFSKATEAFKTSYGLDTDYSPIPPASPDLVESNQE